MLTKLSGSGGIEALKLTAARACHHGGTGKTHVVKFSAPWHGAEVPLADLRPPWCLWLRSL